jgi:hypothetical protein
LYDYRASQHLGTLDAPFYALVMAALRQADTSNAAKIRAAWPEVAAEFEARYNAPGGILPGDPEHVHIPAQEIRPRHHAEAYMDAAEGRGWGWQCLTPGCGADEFGFVSLGAAEAAADRHEEG